MGERACDLAARMARALSDLHAFAAIEAITEHSLLSPDSHAAEQSIRSICQREMRRCVRAHDRAAAALQAAEARVEETEQKLANAKPHSPIEGAARRATREARA